MMIDGEASLIQITPKRFPLFCQRQDLGIYNIYRCDHTQGAQKSQILRYPCIREGCMTTCYFDVRDATPQILRQPCMNCFNPENKKIYLDIGYRTFLEKHSLYIKLSEPLFVQLNPKTMQYCFSCESIRNSLKGQLTSHIGNLIVKELALDESETLNNRIIDFTRVNHHLEGIMKPQVQVKQFHVYSFAKYYPKPSERLHYKHLKLALFFYGKIDPVIVRLTDQKGNHLKTHSRDYLQHGLVVYLGSVKTFFFSIPNENITQYYRSSIDEDYKEEEKTLVLHTKNEWKDDMSRRGGRLLADQKNNHVFSIGGYDELKNTSPDYMTVFRDCRWAKKKDKREFYVTLEKNPNIFKTRVANFNLSTFSSQYRNPLIDNTIALKGASFLLYYSSHSKENFKDSSKQVIQKMFFNVGGGVRDAAVFSSGRFVNQKPGVRYIQYRPTSNQNPIIHEPQTNVKSDLHFAGDDYIMVELPQIQQPGRQFMYKNHCLVFGGRKRLYDRQGQGQEKTDFSRVYRVFISRIDKSIKMGKEHFRFQNIIPNNLDVFISLLRESSGEKEHKEQGNFYLRGTFPLKEPVLYKKYDQKKKVQLNFWVHFIVFEYNLSTSEFRLTPFVQNQSSF